MKSLFTIATFAIPQVAAAAGVVHAIVMEPSDYGFVPIFEVAERFVFFAAYVAGGGLLSIPLSAIALLRKEPFAKHTCWFSIPILCLFLSAGMAIGASEESRALIETYVKAAN